MFETSSVQVQRFVELLYSKLQDVPKDFEGQSEEQVEKTIQ
jgi:hypothetical protein